MNFESVHNYYERLVFSRIVSLSQSAKLPREQWEDVACIALNQLPARYVRYDVDTAFFLSSDDRKQMEEAVVTAVDYAIELVQRDKRSASGG